MLIEGSKREFFESRRGVIYCRGFAVGEESASAWDDGVCSFVQRGVLWFLHAYAQSFKQCERFVFGVIFCAAPGVVMIRFEQNMIFA